MAPDLNLLGYGSIIVVVGWFSLRFALNWLKVSTQRGVQAQALYDIERAAHIATRETKDAEIDDLKNDLQTERGLRKAAEMELRESNIAHDHDRTVWRGEREELRDLTETLRGEVRILTRQVSELRTAVNDKPKYDPT